MANKIYDYVVIGAGISGLSLAHHLKNHRNKDVLVLEKSRGVGGRIATRRDESFTFDHGTQFIKKDEFTKELVQHWNELGLLQNIGGDLFCAIGGMTKLAKEMAATLNIELDKKVSKVSYQDKVWTIEDNESRFWTARNIILTPPIPQIIELLIKSSIDFPQDLKKITYSKALVFIIKGENTGSRSPYQEMNSSPVFSLSSQLLKGTSTSDGQVVVMTPEWSERHFDEADEVILELGREVLHKELPDLAIQSLQLKKWRYAFPQNIYSKPFLSLEHGLYLAGDGFGGGNLNEALKSSRSLQEIL